VRPALGWDRRGNRATFPAASGKIGRGAVRSHRRTVVADRGGVALAACHLRTRFERFQGLAAPFPSGPAAVSEPQRFFLSWVLLFPKVNEGPAPFVALDPCFCAAPSANESWAARLKWADPKELAHRAFPAGKAEGSGRDRANAEPTGRETSACSARTRFEPIERVRRQPFVLTASATPVCSSLSFRFPFQEAETAVRRRLRRASVQR
jgi:hypothetical protein